MTRFLVYHDGALEHELHTHLLVLLGTYSALAFAASLVGGWIPIAVRLTHTRLQTAISFVAGLMLSMALLHLIPHAVFQIQSVDRVVGWALAGFVVTFFLQRFLPHHHHDVPEGDPEDCSCGHSHAHPTEKAGAEPAPHTLAAKSARKLSWAGTAAGLTMHSLLDGVALAAAVAAETHGDTALAGLGTAAVVVLHKPFDSLSITTLMSASGCSERQRHWINTLYALVCPLGAGLFILGVSQFGTNGVVFGSALAFCAGTFLCISCSDLLPELQFHSHDRFKLSTALLLGIVLAMIIGRFETSGHDHSHRAQTLEQKSHEHGIPEDSDHERSASTGTIESDHDHSEHQHEAQAGRP